ncbi:ferredoxin-fold anticodon-binding domain-containing protein 1-like [Spea bombifrons]|uniref:ferredoxin-fold anticodon-binding domain-containing protein 1-like n=1 Tax=Spea bombifrons TaxID=233779 RepID=UPI00234B74AE|nr:ferredoxin-fold anticodon-binding domain-containing protein 1-like [Spea bombifrons]
MAARAGFVLRQLFPLPVMYTVGQSTGYRSQEKSFLADGSLNHIFTRGLPVENMIPLDIISMLMGTPPSRQTPEWCDKIGDLLRRDPCHPTNLLNDKLVAFLGQSMILNHFKDTFPLVRETCVSSACPWQSESQASLYYTRTTDKNEIPSTDFRDLQEKKASCDKNTYVMDVHATCDENTDQNFRISYLRPSLTHCIDCIIKKNHISSNSLYVLSGPVFRKCLISPWIMPVYRETLIMLGFQSNNATAHHQLLIDAVEKAIMSLVTFTSSESICFVKNELESCTNVNPLTAHQKLTDAHYTINMSAPACNGDQVVGRIISVLPGQLSNNFGLLLVTINIDLITLLLLDVPDWRLLWTADARFMQQYKFHQLKPFQTLSLYPPYYVHDVSFWVGEGSVFDDIEFHTIVQRVSKGTVVRIQLQDRFENSTARKTSLCYRVIYQSCDRALSYEAASAMQLLLREELQRCLSVTLR